MLLNVREISIKSAVGGLFLIAFIGWFSGLEPLACSKRAVLGAFAAYIITKVMARIVNQIMIGAYVKSQIEEQQGQMSEHAG